VANGYLYDIPSVASVFLANAESRTAHRNVNVGKLNGYASTTSSFRPRAISIWAFVSRWESSSYWGWGTHYGGRVWTAWTEPLS